MQPVVQSTMAARVANWMFDLEDTSKTTFSPSKVRGYSRSQISVKLRFVGVRPSRANAKHISPRSSHSKRDQTYARSIPHRVMLKHSEGRPLPCQCRQVACPTARKACYNDLGIGLQPIAFASIRPTEALGLIQSSSSSTSQAKSMSAWQFIGPTLNRTSPSCALPSVSCAAGAHCNPAATVTPAR